MMNQTLFKYQLDGWNISWESSKTHRHWCFQEKEKEWPNVIIVLFNPGSLSDTGINLRNDTTLRILREVFGGAKVNPFIINLFDYAATKPNLLFDNWGKKDSIKLVYDLIPFAKFSAYCFAYGDYENGNNYNDEIFERQKVLRSIFRHSGLKELALLKNNSGTPMHPMSWQRRKLKPTVVKMLKAVHSL
jgi:hypothetical protein